MEWGPHMDPTPLCLGVVSLLCSVSVKITPREKKVIADITLSTITLFFVANRNLNSDDKKLLLIV